MDVGAFGHGARAIGAGGLPGIDGRTPAARKGAVSRVATVARWAAAMAAIWASMMPIGRPDDRASAIMWRRSDQLRAHQRRAVGCRTSSSHPESMAICSNFLRSACGQDPEAKQQLRQHGGREEEFSSFLAFKPAFYGASRRGRVELGHDIGIGNDHFEPAWPSVCFSRRLSNSSVMSKSRPIAWRAAPRPSSSAMRR